MFEKGINFPFLKNSDGKKDGMWTLAVGSFLIVVIQATIGGSSFTGSLFGLALDFKVPVTDSATVAALTSSYLTYWGRRNKVGSKAEPAVAE
jgi:hypothetical protein